MSETMIALLAAWTLIAAPLIAAEKTGSQKVPGNYNRGTPGNAERRQPGA